MLAAMPSPVRGLGRFVLGFIVGAAAARCGGDAPADRITASPPESAVIRQAVLGTAITELEQAEHIFGTASWSTCGGDRSMACVSWTR
jgi:hypothetical protein